MFRNIFKLTSTTFKCPSSMFSQINEDVISPELIETWLKDIQVGLDAIFDDRILNAEDSFLKNQEKDQSPFYGFGYAILIYIKAMLSLEKDKIEEALEYIQNLESIIKRVMVAVRKNKKQPTSNGLEGQHSKLPNVGLSTSYSSPVSSQFHESNKSSNKSHGICDMEPNIKVGQDSIILHLELLQANCIVISATLQWMNNSWIDNFKAAYELRKAFKMYERLFETISGFTLEYYEKCTQSQNKKRNTIQCTRRVVSFNDSISKTCNYQGESDKTLYKETLQYGIYFGIGLFNIVFLSLPMKARKVLNSLGFVSSRALTTSLLAKSCKSETMYSSLSSILLLSFHTSISIYIQPQLNYFLSFEDILFILNKTRSRYPNGKIWHFIEGKFKRLEGEIQESLLLYKKARCPVNVDKYNSKTDIDLIVDKKGNFRTTSVLDFVQFRSLIIYEMGWSYLYSGDYYQASESFFCLESLCNWSRIFYHYMSTCCLVANKQYQKAGLEVKQIVHMLDYKKKIESKFSINEQYAESKVSSWIKHSEQLDVSLEVLLQYHIVNPVWELVYLWNGANYWSNKTITDIQDQILNRWSTDENIKPNEPLLCLIMGVIHRDKLKDINSAMECFNIVLLWKDKKVSDQSWTIPYAMYEIAATHALSIKPYRVKNNTSVVIISEWIKSIENYYIDNPQDKEWERRMEIRCQLLLESCNNI